MTKCRRNAQSWENDIEQLLVTYTETWSFEGSPDWSKIEALYARDADLVFYDAFLPDPLIGRAAMIGHARTLFAAIAKLTVSSAGPCTLRLSEQGTVVTATKIAFHGYMNNGDVKKLTMRLSLVWECHGDHWVIVHEHVSSARRLYETDDQRLRAAL